METITTLITSVGFPIACCIFMWHYINTTLKDFTKTMNENTRMIERLCEKIDKKDDV